MNSGAKLISGATLTKGAALFIGKRIVQALLILLLALLLLVALAFAFNLTIKLTRFAPYISETIESTSGVNIHIDGEILFTLGSTTEVNIDGFRWQQRDSDKLPFLQFERGVFSFDFWSLFGRQISIEKIALSTVDLNLVIKKGMKLNIPELDLMALLEWINHRADELPLFIAEDIELKQASLTFLVPEKNLKGDLVFDHIDASWGWNSPLQLFGDGVLHDDDPYPISIALKGDPFKSLGVASKEWTTIFNIAGNQADIATTLTLTGEDAHALEEDEVALAKNRTYALAVEVNQLQYGKILSNLGVEGAGHGHLNAHIFLQGMLTNLDQPLVSSTGTIELAVWPSELRANPLDFWAINIINMLLIGLSEDSKVNCAVARFDLTDSILTSEALIFDTSRLRVYGSGNINLLSREIDIWIEAKAKQLQWLSKDVPVRLSGSIDNPKIELKKMGIFKSAVKSVVNFTLPLLPVLINDTMESDGSKDCLMSMQANRGRIKE